MALTPAQQPDERGFRRPALTEALTLLAGEGAILVIGTALVLITGWPPMPWIVAAVMLLVLVQWVAGLRVSARRLSEGGAAASRHPGGHAGARDDAGPPPSGTDVGGLAGGGGGGD